MKTPNTIYQNATVTRERRNKINNHNSLIIWFTGLSGSGKSTLANSVEEELHNLYCFKYEPLLYNKENLLNHWFVAQESKNL